MKTLKLTLAAVLLSAFTMNAQKNADAAAVKSAAETVQTKTEAPKQATKVVQEQATKAVQVKDSDAVSVKESSTTSKKVAKKAVVSKATIIENEKAEKAAKATKAVKKDN